MSLKPLLSIVCPAYQESEVLPLFQKELARVIESIESDYRVEILYVDDGSRDDTLQVLQEMARQDARVRYLSFTRNFGKEAALVAGLENARGDLVVTMDSDLQHPPVIIPQLLEKAAEGHNIVMAIRQEYQAPEFVKRVLTRVFYRVMDRLSETAIDSTGSDFLLLRRPVLNTLLRMQERHRFLKGLIYWLGYPFGVVRFKPEARKAGITKFNFVRLAALGTDCLFSFSKKPLKIATHMGSLILGVGMVWTVVLMFQAILGGGGSWMASYLLISSHLFSGSILLGIGVLGEYIGRTFEQVKGRPLYVIKASSDAIEELAPARDQRKAA